MQLPKYLGTAHVCDACLACGACAACGACVFFPPVAIAAIAATDFLLTTLHLAPEE